MDIADNSDVAVVDERPFMVLQWFGHWLDHDVCAFAEIDVHLATERLYWLTIFAEVFVPRYALHDVALIDGLAAVVFASRVLSYCVRVNHIGIISCVSVLGKHLCVAVKSAQVAVNPFSVAVNALPPE